MHSENEHCKEGWINEVERKFKIREIEAMNDDQKVEIKTENKSLMEHALEHVGAIKGNKEDLR